MKPSFDRTQHRDARTVDMTMRVTMHVTMHNLQFRAIANLSQIFVSLSTDITAIFTKSPSLCAKIRENGAIGCDFFVLDWDRSGLRLVRASRLGAGSVSGTMIG
jgi:hypothetical protein